MQDSIKKKQRKHFSLNITISIGCSIFILILCSILALVSYNVSTNVLYSRYQAQMTSIVDLAQSSVDDADMAECAATFVKSAKFEETKAYFDNFVNNYSDLHYLYILKPMPEGEEINIRTICSAATDEEKEAGEDYDLGYGEVGWYDDESAAFFREIMAGTEDVFYVGATDFGVDYTLARPLVVKDETSPRYGEHYAVLCVDVSIDTINKAVTDVVITTLAWIFGIGIFFIIIMLVWLFLSVIRPIKHLQTSVKDFANKSRDNYNPDELVFVTPNIFASSEIQELRSDIEKMSIDMRNYVIDILNKETSLEEMSLIAHSDALTGLKNKASYDKVVEYLNEMIKQKNAEFAIVMVDINNLKGINDNYGHENGDIYIVGAANIVNSVYKNSPVFRIGGDEIVVILEGEDYKNREKLLKQVKAQFEASSHNMKSVEYKRYSAAAGMAVFDNNVDKDVESVFARADKEMYINKAKMKESK